MIRYFGAFVINYLRPLIKETDSILRECEALNISGKEVEKWMQSAIGCWMFIEVVKSISYVIITSIFCYTVYLILR